MFVTHLLCYRFSLTNPLIKPNHQRADGEKILPKAVHGVPLCFVVQKLLKTYQRVTAFHSGMSFIVMNITRSLLSQPCILCSAAVNLAKAPHMTENTTSVMCTPLREN